MTRPATRQWVVLWVGALWILLTLAVAEEYVGRGVFAAILITGLLYWQLAPKKPKGSRVVTDSVSAETPVGSVEEVDFAARDYSQVADQTVPAPVGVSGWLALLVIALGIGMPISSLSAISQEASSAEGRWGFGGALIVLALMAAGGVYVSLALGLRWPSAPKTALRFIVAIAILTVIGSVAFISEATDSAEAVGQVLGGLTWALVWGLYLRKSRRVRNTYVATSDKPPTAQAAVRIACAMLVVLVVWLGTVLYSNAQSRVDAQYEEINPYQWIQVTLQETPTFADDFADGVLQKLRATIPNSTITQNGSASFEEAGSAWRAIVLYTAEIDNDGGATTSVEGEVRTYFHSNGIAAIESGCVPALLQCSGMASLLASAEEALMPRMNSSQLSGILPDGKCESESMPNLTQQRLINVMTCTYTDNEAASLSLSRSSLDEARRDMRSQVNASGEFKRAFVKQVLGLQKRTLPRSGRTIP